MKDVEYELGQLVACMRATGHPIDDNANRSTQDVRGVEATAADYEAGSLALHAQIDEELEQILCARRIDG